MARKFNEKKLVVATHNLGKLKEIRELLAPYNIDVMSAGELNLDEPEETGKTFEENAIIKAIAATKATGLPALADDSGLAVDSLNGDPGIYSARWAGPKKDFDMAMKKVNELLEPHKDKSAHFACCLALSFPDEHVECFTGRVFGKMTWPPKGENGFGFDPVFQPDGYDITFGEMDNNKKQKISHRANAFKMLIENCFKK